MSKKQNKKTSVLQTLLGAIKFVVMSFVWLLVSIYALFVVSNGFIKYYMALSDFDRVERLGLMSIEQLNQEKAETLLSYRKKKFDWDREYGNVCYVHFIGLKKPLPLKSFEAQGYEVVSRSDCVANPANLYESRLRWAAPSFHYDSHKIYLIRGRVDRLEVSRLSEKEGKIYKKDNVEIIFHESDNIAQVHLINP